MNPLKRIIAFILSVSFLLAVSPLNMLFANYQSNVVDVSIDVVSSAASNYTVKLEWANPAWSTTPDTKAVETDRDDIHTPAGYRINYRNASLGEKTYQLLKDEPPGDPNNLATQSEITQTLSTGSLFAYRVIPYHRHSYPSDPIPITGDAPMDNTIQPQDVLLMTDITVEAEGSGTTLTVTWDNPIFDGTDIFTGYKIYYQSGGKNVPNNLSSFTNHRIVSTTDSSIVRTRDVYRDGVQRMTYEINDTSLIQGQTYAVRVEPMYLGDEIRKNARDSTNIITIGNKIYRIAFNTKENIQYRTDEASIAIPLKVMEDGKDSLKLSWQGLSSTIGTIDRIEIFSFSDDNPTQQSMGKIFSSQSMFVTSWQVHRPTIKTYYQLYIYIEGKEQPIESEIAEFDPSAVNITPNKPEISAAHSVNDAGVPVNIQVAGSAFIRYPYNEDEESFKLSDDKIIDTSVYYDLYITDIKENLNDQNLPKSVNLRSYASAIDPEDPRKISFTLTSYYTKDEEGNYVSKPFEQNKLYYIRAYAAKPNGEGRYLYSEASDATEYIPVYKDINAPKTLAKPPLKIHVKDGAEDIEKDYIGIEWKTTWQEVFNENTKSWETSVAVAYDEGALKFLYGRDALKAGAPYRLINFATHDTNVYQIFAAELTSMGFFGAGMADDEKIEEVKKYVSGRTVEFDEGIDYEVYVKEEAVVNTETDYEAYARSIASNKNWIPLTKADGAAENGMQIEMLDEKTMYARISQYNDTEATVAELSPNKTYQIFLRPCRYSEGLNGQASYVFGTTLPEDKSLVIVPTVPILRQVSVSDTTGTLKWAVQSSGLSFIMAYSDRTLNDPSDADYQISTDMINDDGVIKTEDIVNYMNYTIEGLFPETNYYIWVRAYTENPDTGEFIYSEWSNPLYIQTAALTAPTPPKGLGLASEESLNLLNAGVADKLLSADDSYVVIEWFKDSGDLSEAGTASSEEGYNILANPNIIETCLASFTDLKAKTYYYVRAKTTVTLTKTGIEPTERIYKYTLHFSPDDTFTDSVVAEIYTGTDATGDKTITAESVWSATVKVITEQNNEDFDSDKNPDLYPLPDEDYEITFDRGTGTLNYRFRTNKEDAGKNDDQLVDQRFISKLTRNNTFVHAIDLTSHEKFTNPSIRTVQIPYSIMRALSERNISFQITANNLIVSLPPDFLKNEQIKNNSSYGSESIVNITLAEMPSGLPAMPVAQSYVSIPQKLTVTVTTKSGIIQLKNAEKDITLTMKIPTAELITNKNLGLFSDTDMTDRWQRTNAVYDAPNRRFSVKTKILGSYAVIAESSIISTSDAKNAAAAYSVATRMSIKNLGSFPLDSPVTANQFNNIVAAVASGSKDADLNAILSQSDFSALKRGNLLVSGGGVTREQGVSILVRLYESKTKARITNFGTVGDSSYRDIQNADSAYQTDLLKAASIGFFKQNSSNPKNPLTLGDTLYMVDIILLDSGS